jgi:hypothetical protein
VKTSSTQERQIHLSRAVTDSGGKGERSRGWALSLSAALALATPEGFRSGDFFFGAGFATFGGLAEGVERRADFLAGMDAGLIFRFGMGKSLCPGLPEISGRQDAPAPE